MKNVKVYYWIPAIALTAAALVACHKDPATVVQQRAVERWNLLIEGHPVKAYDYLSPGYRSTHSLDQYVAFIGTSKVQWKTAQVDSAKCDAETCLVSLTINSTVSGALAQTPRDLHFDAPVYEHWLVSDGQWYFLPDTQITPTTTSGTGSGKEAGHDTANGADASAKPAVAPPAQSTSAPATTSSTGGSDK